LHHQAGNGDPAGVYESRRVSAHFWIPKTGDPVQHVDTGIRAWHGGTDALNGSGIGVETEGCPIDPWAEPLTENQLTVFGELMAWAHQTHGIPLQLSEDAWTPGLNYHRCPGGYPTGCPCDVRVNARAEILSRAGGVPVSPVPLPPTGAGAPPWPGRYFELVDPLMSGADIAQWQAQMAVRGWQLAADGWYGSQSEAVCVQFQDEKGLTVDGVVGPDTWAAAWTAPVT
jgi:peptidoglycan hydrolase-like protein with peptidoglycan-binding domain